MFRRTADYPTERCAAVNEHIRWQLFLQAKSPDKAHLIMDRLAQALNQEIHILECEKYWKDPSLFRATITTLLCSRDVASVVVETLQTGSNLAWRWSVSAPQFYLDHRWEFNGWADAETIRIPGVSAIEFQVGHLQTSEGQAHVEPGKIRA